MRGENCMRIPSPEIGEKKRGNMTGTTMKMETGCSLSTATNASIDE